MAYPFDPITLFETAPAQPKKKKFGRMVGCLFVLALSIFSLFRLNRWWHNPVAGNGQERRKKKRILFFMDVVLPSFGGGGRVCVHIVSRYYTVVEYYEIRWDFYLYMMLEGLYSSSTL